MWSEALGSLDHASRASARAPIVRSCCLADCHLRRRLRPISRFFPRPSVRRQGQPGFPTAGGSASPQGEARRQRRRQGGAQRPPRQGGLRVGVGGAVQPNLTTQPTQNPPPQHPRQQSRTAPPATTPTRQRHHANTQRQREPERRSPARMRRQGGAKRPPRQGGLRVGVGGRYNQTGRRN